MQLDRLALAGSRVPRYTSYPTAPHFHSGIGNDDYRAWLSRISPQTALSLYLHIPFCDRLCWFCGCHTKQVLRRAITSKLANPAMSVRSNAPG